MGAKLLNFDEIAKKRGCKTSCNLSFYPFLIFVLASYSSKRIPDYLKKSLTASLGTICSSKM